jgi:hypothetical protein
MCLISDLCYYVDENCTVLGCYAPSGGNSLLTFGGYLSQNVGKELLLFTA